MNTRHGRAVPSVPSDRSLTCRTPARFHPVRPVRRSALSGAFFVAQLGPSMSTELSVWQFIDSRDGSPTATSHRQSPEGMLLVKNRTVAGHTAGTASTVGVPTDQ